MKNNHGVSHVLGYMLTLSLTAVLVSTISFISYSIIEDKTAAAAQIYAENLADHLRDRISNVCLIKEQYPDAKYSTLYDIPVQLMNKYDYYIEFSNSMIFVNSTNGVIKAHSEIFNAPQRLSIDVDGKIYGSLAVINLSCEPFDYVYKFDFGSKQSSSERSYIHVSNISNSDNWNRYFKDWSYRTPIIITNPTGKTISNGYQILLQFDDTEFDYSTANSNGSDLRFVDSQNPPNNLSYWIERWNPRDTRTSRLWVNLTNLPIGESTIYMYHGNHGATPKSNGTKTFQFFDDFTETTLNQWIKYNLTGMEIDVKNGMAMLTNGSAITTSKSVLSGLSDYYVVETKAKAIGDSVREASMFVRNDGTSTPPYEHAVVFSSGNFSTKNNLTIIVYTPSVYISRTSSDKPAVNQDWNRLTYFVNGSDNIICRYFYENYTAGAAAMCKETSYSGSNHIGLCTIKPGTTAYYDWVLVRKYVINTAGYTREQAIPTARLQDTHSRNYNWSGIITSEIPIYSSDIICNKDGGVNPGTFTIKNLSSNQMYALTFVVGDPLGAYYPYKIVKNMTIEIRDLSSNTLIMKDPDIDCTNTTTNNILMSGITGCTGLKIIFDDKDTGGIYHWAVDKMTIQKGERIIKLKGGK